MTIEELRKIGHVQLDIMDEIHRICETEKITYYIIAGTLLGAVRHGGFIPWDLDIDIGMQREDYERFKEACAKHLSAPYAYLDHENCRCFPRPHALISRTDTQVVVKYDLKNPMLMNLGIYVDVFPLDNAPDDLSLRKKQAKALLKIRKFKSYRIPYSYSRKTWKRYAHYLVSFLLSWIPVRVVNWYQQNQMKKYRFKNSTHICSMASQYAYEKQCMPREIYGTPVLLEFEGRKYYAPEKYKEYLRRLYGNYMQLPPEEKRQANLSYYTYVKFPEESAAEE